MKEIQLTQNAVARVDDADYEQLVQWEWCLVSGKYAGRAIRQIEGARRQRFIFMHKLIIGAPDTSEVDHRDGDMLNNQRLNLRECTSHQNGLNKKKVTHNKYGHIPTSQYKGVHWRKARNRWEVLVMLHGKQIYIGRFRQHQEREAAEAYDVAARKYHGEFARTNF